MRKKFVLIHHYCETSFDSIVAFSDYLQDLNNVKLSYPRFGSSRHLFVIYNNTPSKRVHGVPLNFIKDTCLINICKNVAEFLAVGEYAMFKKSYFKSASWFEKAKNAASLGADIIDNY